MRYASEYISMKLHREDKKSVQFVSCLAKMAVAGNEEGYTTTHPSGLDQLIEADSFM